MSPSRGEVAGSAGPSATAPPRPPPLRRNRDFILLWSGQVVSTIGTRITSVAYPLLVLVLTESPARAGLVGFAQTLPFLLLYLPAGALVDRWDRKKIMLACDAGRAIALGSLAITLPLGLVTLAQIVVVAFVEGMLFVFFTAAEGAALPHIVPREQLPTAIAQNEARMQGADLVGQPLGGFLFGVARLAPFVVDAVSYAVGFCAVLAVRPALQEDRPPVPRRIGREIAEGVRWLWGHPLLRAVVVLVGGSNFVFNALVLVLIVRARELGASPALIGAMFAFYGAGGLLGSFVAPWVQRSIPARAVIIGSMWFWAATTALVVFIGEPVTLGLVAGFAALAGPAFNVVVASYNYALVPDRLQGRVRSTARLIAWGTIPLASLSAGLLLESLGPSHTLLTLAGIAVAVAVGASASPAIRRTPRIEDLA